MKINIQKSVITLAVTISLLAPLSVFAEKNATIKGGVEENIVFTLAQCVDKALENNPEIKAAISDTNIFHSKIGQSRSRFFPRIGVSSGFSRTNPLVNSSGMARPDETYSSYDFSAITMNQMIYDFGKTSNLIKASKLSHKASKENLQATINEITYRVKESYFKLLFAQKQYDIMLDSVNKFQEHLDQATAFYEVGTKPKIDVTIAKSNLSNAKLDLIRAKNEVDIAFAILNNVMGLPNQVQYSIKEDLAYQKLDVSFGKIIDLAYETRPDLKAAKLKVDASKRLLKISKIAGIPDIQASTAYNVGGGDFFEDQGFGFGINLELPVTNGYLLKKQVDESKAQLNKDTALAQKLEHDVFMQAKQAFISLTQADERIPVSEQLLEQAKETYDLSSARYKTGLADAIELKDAELEYKKAQLQHFNSILEYNIAVANLERVVGKSEF